MAITTKLLGPALAATLAASPALAQDFPDPATQLKQRLAVFAVPWLTDEVFGEVYLEDLAATVVCLVEALNPLPDGVKYEMLQTEDFEDALDLAVTYAEGANLGTDLENNLEACL